MDEGSISPVGGVVYSWRQSMYSRTYMERVTEEEDMEEGNRSIRERIEVQSVSALDDNDVP
jgi:hypothetical protein